MEPSHIATLMEHAILTVFFMSAPMLLIGLLIGVGVSIFQAVTQINEVTLVFIPKMLGVGLAADLMQSMGMSVAQLPGGEIVPAMERGVIVAFVAARGRSACVERRASVIALTIFCSYLLVVE